MKNSGKKRDPSKEYDENGKWILEKNMIKGAIRRTFRLSPQMYEVMQAARVELPPKPLKDGSPGKQIQVRFRCACCGELFPSKFVQVDHIDPVVPLHKTEAHMSYDELAERIICDKKNLQVICSTPLKFLPKGQRSCHSWKTLKENYIRDKIEESGGLSQDLPATQLTIYERAFVLYRIDLEHKQKEKEARKQAKLAKKAKNLQTDSK